MATVNFGLNNVHYSIVTETMDPETGAITSSYGPVKAWNGAIDIDLSPEGENSNFFADNRVYYSRSKNNGYSGTFNSAFIPEDVLTEVLGMSADSKGVVVETDADVQKYIAFMFEVDNDDKPNRYCYYKCSLERPNNNSKTTEDSTEPNTNGINIKVMPRADVDTINSRAAHLVKSHANAITDATVYANWYNSVYIPTFEETA